MKTLLGFFTWILLAAALVACDQRPKEDTSVTVEGGYRFAAEPAGLDTPAASCVVCHSIEKDGPLRVAPSLWGIVGAKKARFSWYGYSEALESAGGTWTPKDLDAYLTDPDGYLPGTSKTLIGITDSAKRAKLIAYLETLRD